jgi:hypothetical protein
MLLTYDEYCQKHGMSKRNFYYKIKQGEIKPLEMDGKNYCYAEEDITGMNAEDKKMLVRGLAEQWKTRMEIAHDLYRQAGHRATKQTTGIIRAIETDVKHWELILKIKIKGHDKRSLQIKVKKGNFKRKTRSDKFSFRNNILKDNPGTLDKAVDLVTTTYFQDALGNINLAIDRAIHHAKNNEEHYEVAAVNIHTLRRHIRRVASQSGFKEMHDFLNHHNTYRKGLAYNKGAFTNDIQFGEVFSMDDHKFDVAGCLVFNEATGKMEQKHIYSWFVVEMKTMYPLAWMIKATPFSEEDIVRLLMRCFRQYGLPTDKLICDQGLGKSERIKDFCRKLDLTLEPQEPYCPTQKAVNERLFGVIKAECDVYNENFTGSNHPVEGRHRDRRLSPEETTEMVNEAVARYDNYVTGYYLDRPRTRQIEGIDHLKDNSGRVSTRALYEYFYSRHMPKRIDDRMLRYAYMKYDSVKSFSGYLLKYKGEAYIPDSSLSITLYSKDYTYTIAYDPDNLNSIDLYSNQDILDRLNGDYIAKGDYVCTLQSIANLPTDEKARKVTMYNKSIQKNIKQLANTYRAKAALEKDLVNYTAGDEGLLEVMQEQKREVEKIIKESIPMRKIAEVVSTVPQQQKTVLSDVEDMDFDELNTIEA